MLREKLVVSRNHLLNYPKEIVRVMIRYNVYIVQEITDGKTELRINQKVLIDGNYKRITMGFTPEDRQPDNKYIIECVRKFIRSSLFEPTTDMDINLYEEYYDFEIDEYDILNMGPDFDYLSEIKTDDEVLAESTLDIKKISLRSGDILLIQYPTGLAPRYFEKLMKSLEPLKILFEKRNVHCLVAPNTITFTKIEQK